MCGILGQTGWWLTVLRTILCGTGTFTTSPGVRVSPHARSLNHHDHLSQWGHTTPVCTMGCVLFPSLNLFLSQAVKQLDPVFANVVDSQAHIAAPLAHAFVHGRSRMPSLLACLSQRIHQDVRKPSNETNYRLCHGENLKRGVLILNPRILRNFRGTFLIQKYDIWKIWITSFSEHQKLSKSVH